AGPVAIAADGSTTSAREWPDGEPTSTCAIRLVPAGGAENRYSALRILGRSKRPPPSVVAPATQAASSPETMIGWFGSAPPDPSRRVPCRRPPPPRAGSESSGRDGAELGRASGRK